MWQFFRFSTIYFRFERFVSFLSYFLIIFVKFFWLVIFFICSKRFSHYKSYIFHLYLYFTALWKVLIWKLQVCPIYPKICFSASNFSMMMLRGISIHKFNFFVPKSIYSDLMNTFTISALFMCCVLFTLFLAQLLNTLIYCFETQLQILCTLTLYPQTFFSKL